MRNIINWYTVQRFLVSILYPNRCPFCETIIDADAYSCISCLTEINPAEKREDVFACCYYDMTTKGLIHKAKEEGNGYAISACAKLLYDTLSQQGAFSDVNCVAAIPPHKQTVKRRGYSFPQCMAKEISGLAHISYAANLLVLKQEVEQQKSLSAKQRKENMKDAFLPGKYASIDQLSILLIDDVCTTGSTLTAAQNKLLEMGAKQVVKAAFACTKLEKSVHKRELQKENI